MTREKNAMWTDWIPISSRLSRKSRSAILCDVLLLSQDVVGGKLWIKGTASIDVNAETLSELQPLAMTTGWRSPYLLTSAYSCLDLSEM